MRGRDLTEFEKGQIYALRFYAHWQFNNIAGTLQLNLNAIKMYCNRINNGHSIHADRLLNCGRRRKTTMVSDATLRSHSEENRFLTATSLQRAIPDLRNVYVRTIQRRLNLSD